MKIVVFWFKLTQISSNRSFLLVMISVGSEYSLVPNRQKNMAMITWITDEYMRHQTVVI